METLEEVVDEGEDSFRPRRRYAFRLVTNGKPVPRTPQLEGQQGVGNGRGGEEGGGGDALGVLSLDLDDADPSRARKVWILAATSEEVCFRPPKRHCNRRRSYLSGWFYEVTASTGKGAPVDSAAFRIFGLFPQTLGGERHP